jgi:hypothetical protein
VVDNLTLYQGKTLTIQAGVVVKFTNNTEMKIKGILKVSGTSSNRVLFTNLSPNYNMSGYHGSPINAWYNSTGIRYWVYVDSPNGGSVDISYAKFEYSRIYALYIAEPDTDDGKQDKLTDLIFENNSGGLYGYSGPRSDVSVKRCSFKNNHYGVPASDYSFYDCIFKNNIWGIHYSYSVHNSVFQNNPIGTSQVDYVYNSIVQNSTRGIYSGSMVFNCTLYDNEFGLYYIQKAYNCSIFNNKVGAIGSTVKYSKIFQNELGLNSSNSIRNSIFNNTNGLHQIYDNRDYVKYNNIYNNNNYNFILSSKNDHNCSYNWWGTTDTSKIIPKIYDIWDNPTVGEAFYKPILTSSVDTTFQLPIADAGLDQNVLFWQPVYFDGSGSYVPDNFSTEYRWNFGDGSQSDLGSDCNSTHIYTSPGTYIATLTIYYDDYIQVKDTCTIRVTQRPVANAGSDQQVKVNQTVNFDGSGSSDLDGDNLTFYWDFGDGNSSGWLSQSNTTHVYTQPGTYTVTLNVSDGEFTDEDICIITVTKSGGSNNTGVDTDHDGLIDADEVKFGTDQNDPDSDDDGVLDGDEELVTYEAPDHSTNDPDSDGWNNARDSDSDGDGILDGTEKGVTDTDINLSATDQARGYFYPDQDPSTTTDMTKKDTDGDTHSDGDEDRNANGKYEPEMGETDPNFKDYDNDGLHDDTEDADDDNDGMSDDFELSFTSACNPLDESDKNEDFDGDGYTNYREYLGDDNSPGNWDWSSPEDPNDFPIVGPKTDSDQDSVPDDLDKFPFDDTQWNDTDGDGYGDNPNGNFPDMFPDDPTQWSDLDGDGYGDNPNGTDSDQFPFDPDEWKDTDGDGIGDNSDPYPNDPSTDIYHDTDGDDVPDSYDAFPKDPAASVDSDGDHYPDYWNDGKTGDDSTTDLELDAYPNDPNKHSKVNGDDTPDFALITILIIIVVVILISVTILKAFVLRPQGQRHRPEEPPSDEEFLEQVRYKILNGEPLSELDVPVEKIDKLLGQRYHQGLISQDTYNFIKTQIIVKEEPPPEAAPPNYNDMGNIKS